MDVEHDAKLGAMCACDACLERERREYAKALQPHPEDGTFVDGGPWDLDYDWFGGKNR